MNVAATVLECFVRSLKALSPPVVNLMAFIDGNFIIERII